MYTFPSQVLDTRRSSFGLQSTPVTGAPCRSRSNTFTDEWYDFSVYSYLYSHILIVWSFDADASLFPVWLKATLSTPPFSCPSTSTLCPVRGYHKRNIMSSDELTSTWPSRLQETVVRMLSWKHSMLRRSPDHASQIQISWPLFGPSSNPLQPVARQVPSGFQATEKKPLLLRSICDCESLSITRQRPSNCKSWAPVVKSHTRTVSSVDAVAILSPLGLQHTLFTLLVCPAISNRNSPVMESHTLTVLSAALEASSLSSGLHATWITAAECPSSFKTSAPNSCSPPNSELHTQASTENSPLLDAHLSFLSAT